MNLTLTRKPADGKSVRGLITSPTLEGAWGCLENADYLIPAGTYPLAVTYSPRFKRQMPLVCGVVGAPGDPTRPRAGIRFHPGTKPEHSTGCILVTRAHEDQLRILIQREACTLTIK